MFHKNKAIKILMLSCIGAVILSGCEKKSEDDNSLSNLAEETDYLSETESAVTTEETYTETEPDDSDTEDSENSSESSTEASEEVERPTYTASDYMSVGNYIGITVTDIEVEEVTEDDVASWIETLFEEQGWEFSSLDDLTQEQVATLSNQKYLDVDSYLDYIYDFIEERRNLYRIKDLFIDIWEQVEDTYVFEGFPEDTYKYDTETVDIVAEYAARFGLTKEKMEEVLEDHPDTMDLIIEKVENQLKEEMIINYIADEQGLELGQDPEGEQEMISTMFGYDTYEELQENYDQEDIDYYTLYMKVAQYVVSKANIVDAE